MLCTYTMRCTVIHCISVQDLFYVNQTAMNHFPEGGSDSSGLFGQAVRQDGEIRTSINECKADVDTHSLAEYITMYGL